MFYISIVTRQPQVIGYKCITLTQTHHSGTATNHVELNGIHVAYGKKFLSTETKGRRVAVES